jgi:thiol-disulfide isomerase/thioredoxin
MQPGRRRLVLTGVGLTALAGGLGLALHRTTGEQASAGAVARVFAQVFEDPQGRAQPMAQWKGRWLVLNFWATWCAPCIEEMPTLQRVAREYEARGVTVVGLGIDNVDAIRKFQTQLKLELPLLVAGAEGSELARDLGNSSGALPYTVLISPRGTVVQTRLGLIRPELLRSWLDAEVTT